MAIDGCNTFYLFNGRAQCLHQLFRTGQIKVITKETTQGGTEFYIFADKPKEKSQAWKRGWWRNGRRSRIQDRGNIFLAVDLADKYHVKKVRIKYGKIIQQ